MGTIFYSTDPNAKTGVREATCQGLIAGARHPVAIRVRKGAVMASSNAARDHLTTRLAPRDHEVFKISFLDSQHRLIGQPYQGRLNTLLVTRGVRLVDWLRNR